MAAAEGASIDAADPLGELSAAHATLGSSMQRDIAAGRAPELDAIPGAVLRAARPPRPGVPDDRAAGGERSPSARVCRHRSLRAERRATVERLRRLLAERPEATLARPGGDGLRGDRLDDLLLGLLAALVVLPVAEHAEVAGDAAVGVDRDAGQDLLALLEAEALQVEVSETDAVGGVRGVLAVVRGHRLGEALEVLGDLAGVSHRSPEA